MAERLADQLSEVDRLAGERELPRLEPGEIDQIMDHPAQPPREPPDLLNPPLQRGIAGVLLGEEVRAQVDAAQRLPEVVRDGDPPDFRA